MTVRVVAIGSKDDDAQLFGGVLLHDQWRGSGVRARPAAAGGGASALAGRALESPTLPERPDPDLLLASRAYVNVSSRSTGLERGYVPAYPGRREWAR